MLSIRKLGARLAETRRAVRFKRLFHLAKVAFQRAWRPWRTCLGWRL